MPHPETDTPQDEPIPNETELKISVYNAQSGIRAHYPYRRKVSSLLRDLNLDPETVLVIQNNALLTADEWLDPLMEVEIRPVISGGSGGSPDR
jgi:sulfur carrier protein